jgi:hypothetical protein
MARRFCVRGGLKTFIHLIKRLPTIPNSDKNGNCMSDEYSSKLELIKTAHRLNKSRIID